MPESRRSLEVLPQRTLSPMLSPGLLDLVNLSCFEDVLERVRSQISPGSSIELEQVSGRRMKDT